MLKLVRSGFAVLVTFAFGLIALWLDPATGYAQQQAIACVGAPVTADPSPTVCISRVLAGFDGVSPNNQFYVSWRSAKPEVGQVKVTDGETFNDVRGATFKGVTHYVLVNNLSATETYQFDIVSGDKTYDNDGDDWSVKLGKPITGTTTPYAVFGRVRNPDGSAADGTIVYAYVRDADSQGTANRSTLLSALIVEADGSDFFNLNVEDARRPNGAKFLYKPDGDRIVLTAAGAQGGANKTFVVSDLHPPKPPATLTLSAGGTGTAATATPTLIPPTYTITPSTTPTETITPEPTETFTPEPTLEPTATDTPFAEPTADALTPTLSPAQETEVAILPLVTPGADAAGLDDGDFLPTPVRGPISSPAANAEDTNRNLLLLTFAIVLIVGAALLGAAAFFVWRK